MKKKYEFEKVRIPWTYSDCVNVLSTGALIQYNAVKYTIIQYETQYNNRKIILKKFSW